ncbi:MAG TPA: hypothetical protein VGN36_06720, partial [Sphingorhabdus sp.]|nr:hypothetical protein [Sphingorhabdus sp.]
MAAAKASLSSAKIDSSLLQAMASAFTESALPGENEGFDAGASEAAARFTLEQALKRKAGTAAVALDSFTDAGGRLAMRIAMNNDDMPFLVDSVSAALAAKGIIIRRLIHPVLSTKRDEAGDLRSVSRKREGGITRESFIYIETDRIDAKER